MTLYVALLRAVNLGGSTMVNMTALRELLGRRGFAGVQTLLQSGNLVFPHPVAPPSQLEEKLETVVFEGLGKKCDIFVRSAAEWRGIVAGNPFPKEARSDPGLLVVTILKRTPEATAWAALKAAIRGPEKIRPAGRHAYIYFPNGQGRSQLSPALIERKLGTQGTNRNWNTVTKLERMSSA